MEEDKELDRLKTVVGLIRQINETVKRISEEEYERILEYVDSRFDVSLPQYEKLDVRK